MSGWDRVWGRMEDAMEGDVIVEGGGEGNVRWRKPPGSGGGEGGVIVRETYSFTIGCGYEVRNQPIRLSRCTWYY